MHLRFQGGGGGSGQALYRASIPEQHQEYGNTIANWHRALPKIE